MTDCNFRKRAAAAEFMEEDQPFRKNAFKIIDEMVNLNIPPSEDKSLLVDEVCLMCLMRTCMNF